MHHIIFLIKPAKNKLWNKTWNTSYLTENVEMIHLLHEKIKFLTYDRARKRWCCNLHWWINTEFFVTLCLWHPPSNMCHICTFNVAGSYMLLIKLCYAASHHIIFINCILLPHHHPFTSLYTDKHNSQHPYCNILQDNNKFSHSPQPAIYFSCFAGCSFSFSTALCQLSLADLFFL